MNSYTPALYAPADQSDWIHRLSEELIELEIEPDVVYAIARAKKIEDWQHLHQAFKKLPPSMQANMIEPWQFLVLSGETEAFHEAYAQEKSSNGENPLHYAICSESEAQIDRALDLGIPWNSVNKQGWNILHFAALTSPQLISKVKQLEAAHKEKLPLNTKKQSLIHLAAYSGNREIVDKVLGKFVLIGEEDLHKKDKQGATALNYALRRDAHQVIACLKKAGLKEMLDQEEFSFEPPCQIKTKDCRLG